MTNVSSIDHVYTNVKHRCSEVAVTSFGSSDHDIIGYTRYSKEPPAPARIIKRRSYKNFESKKFLEDLALLTWEEILSCLDIDLATDIFTSSFKSVLDIQFLTILRQIFGTRSSHILSRSWSSWFLPL